MYAILRTHRYTDPRVLELTRTTAPADALKTSAKLMEMLQEQYTDELKEIRERQLRGEEVETVPTTSFFKNIDSVNDITIAIIKMTQAHAGVGQLMMSRNPFEANLLDFVISNMMAAQLSAKRNKRFWAAIAIGAFFSILPWTLHKIKQRR